MVYNRDHFFENAAAKDLKAGDMVSLYDEDAKKEHVGSVKEVEDLGIIDEWVYDLEVEDDMHAFYADDILIHNSQFINLRAIT